MGRTACTDPQCLYKGALYLFFFSFTSTEGHQLNVLNKALTKVVGNWNNINFGNIARKY